MNLSTFKKLRFAIPIKPYVPLTWHKTDDSLSTLEFVTSTLAFKDLILTSRLHNSVKKPKQTNHKKNTNQIKKTTNQIKKHKQNKNWHRMEKHGEKTLRFSIEFHSFPSNVFQRKMVEMQSVCLSSKLIMNNKSIQSEKTNILIHHPVCFYGTIIALST